MSTFTVAQLANLTERRLARIATVGADGTPHQDRLSDGLLRSTFGIRAIPARSACRAWLAA
jgi:hypothetical protein